MARSPSYPEDQPVGEPVGKSGPTEQDGSPPPADKGGEPKRARRIVTGAAIGIGSAALVAALLYANRSRKNDNGGRKGPPRED